ncbi:MAG: TorF family putative porin [Burkholderiaceae bacterium]|nr:TorF family putative porin [Burkholderiaceae bacterium]
MPMNLLKCRCLLAPHWRAACAVLSAAGCALAPCNVAHAADPAPGTAAPAPALTVGGNVTLVSDYLVRGISQTQHKPTLQGEIDFSHASGWYGAIFGSGVSNAAYPNGSGSEIDLVAGWQFALPADLGLNLSYNAYFYPGGHTDDRIKFDTQEIKVALSYDTFSVGVAVVSSPYVFGIYDYGANGKPLKSRGSTYLEANWNPVLAEGVTLNLHAGHQRIRQAGEFNFSDYKIGVTLDGKLVRQPGWTASLAWTYNNGNRSLWTFFNSDGSSRVVVGSRVSASIAYNF